MEFILIKCNPMNEQKDNRQTKLSKNQNLAINVFFTENEKKWCEVHVECQHHVCNVNHLPDSV